jgi:hypothetical protein
MTAMMPSKAAPINLSEFTRYVAPLADRKHSKRSPSLSARASGSARKFLRYETRRAGVVGGLVSQPQWRVASDPQFTTRVIGPVQRGSVIQVTAREAPASVGSSPLVQAVRRDNLIAEDIFFLLQVVVPIDLAARIAPCEKFEPIGRPLGAPPMPLVTHVPNGARDRDSND